MSGDRLSLVRYHVDRGRHAYRNRAIGLYVAAAAVLGLTAAIVGAEFYRAGPMVLVGILGLAGAGFHLWYRSLSWSRHPVLVALVEAPERVVGARVVQAHGKAARLDERGVELRTESASILLTVKVHDLEGLRDALLALCPEAKTHGFPDGRGSALQPSGSANHGLDR